MDYEDGMEEQHGHPDEDDNDHQHEQVDNAPRVSQHIVLPAIINESKAHALYDPGSNASFISTSYARHYKIPMIPLAKTRKIGFADGDRPAARVTHYALVHVSIGRKGAQHHEQLLVFIYDIQYDMILRLP
jgi:predicted aspartyl protease